MDTLKTAQQVISSLGGQVAELQYLLMVANGEKAELSERVAELERAAGLVAPDEDEGPKAKAKPVRAV